MALRAPVAVKLIGAYLLSLALVVGFFLAAPTAGWPVDRTILVLLASGTIFLALAFIALLPLRGLEAVASRVWRGDFGARVEDSAVADQDVKRIGSMFNLLLDGLTADRARMRVLASSIIEAGDRERARLARELHDSTAQQLAALKLQLSAAARDSADPALSERLGQMQTLAGEALEEVRLLAHTVYPRVLDDLGLTAALSRLARETTAVGTIDVSVATDGDGSAVPPTPSAVLYRVAQTAIHNTLKHAQAAHAELRLTVGQHDATLDVIDDGRGFDVEEAERRRPGMGLFTMRERVALVGGTFDVRSKPGSGTHVVAVVPLREPSASSRPRGQT
jgi:signal transduction histidine kinase